ncbi:hypothetical protein ACSLFT_10845 [Streptomyces sp. G6]|uniref:hypothetical protein n=1 Tax=Streptomyces sp. G6 TaxID=1178736 RepID=UPI003ED929F3
MSYEEGDWVETAVQPAVCRPDVTSSPPSEVTQGLQPYSAEISTLVAQGYEVSIRVTGFVGNGSSFSLTSWDDPTAALLIAGKGLTPQIVTKTLGIVPSSALLPTNRSRFQPDERVWAVRITTTPDQGFDSALDELIDLMADKLRDIQKLSQAGLTVQIDLSGRVATRAHGFVSPRSLSRVAALALPLSFTVGVASSERSEDAWDWLPAADGAHRAPV